MYSIHLGQQIIDKFINDPNNHIFFAFGKTRQISITDLGNGSIEETGADGITTSHFYQDFDGTNGVVNFKGKGGKYEYFQNFNGVKLPGGQTEDQISFVTLKNNSINRLSNAMGHESGYHVLFKDSPSHEVWASGPFPKLLSTGKNSPYKFSPFSFESIMRNQLINQTVFQNKIGLQFISKRVSQAVLGISNSSRKAIRTPRYRH